MAKNLLIESTMSYGDVSALPLDFLRSEKNKYITINFDCLFEMIPKNRDENNRGNYDQTKVPFDSIKFDYKPRGIEFLKFSLKKICYQLKPGGKGINNLKLIYLNIDGKEEVLLDTSEGRQGVNFETIEFEDGEIIESVIEYSKNEILCGFDITTNKILPDNNKRNILIGIRANEGIDKEDVMRIPAGNKVIVGIQCYANEVTGVTGISFHRVDKSTFSIYQTSGIRQLRAKVKKNEEYVKELDALKAKLTPEQILLADTCNLPDTIFFTVLKYVMPYKE